MQNSLNKERNIVEFTSPTKVATDVIKGSTISPMSKIIEPKTAQIKPLKLNCIYVVKKDGTKEEFDNNKIINAVKKICYKNVSRVYGCGIKRNMRFCR